MIGLTLQMIHRIRKVFSATLLDAQRLVVLADASQPEVVVLDNNGKRSNTISLPFNPLTIKAAGSNLLLFDKAEVMLIDPISGAEVSRQNVSDVRDADALGDRTVVLSGNQIKYQNNVTPLGSETARRGSFPMRRSELLDRGCLQGSEHLEAGRSGVRCR